MIYSPLLAAHAGRRNLLRALASQWGITDSPMQMRNGVTFWAVQQASHSPWTRAVLSSMATHHWASTESEGSNTASHASRPCSPPDAQVSAKLTALLRHACGDGLMQPPGTRPSLAISTSAKLITYGLKRCLVARGWAG